jgi:hypothetical protein
MIVGDHGHYWSVFVAAAIVTFWRQGPTKAATHAPPRAAAGSRAQRARRSNRRNEAAAQARTRRPQAPGFRLQARPDARSVTGPVGSRSPAFFMSTLFQAALLGGAGSHRVSARLFDSASPHRRAVAGFADPGSVFTVMIQLG